MAIPFNKLSCSSSHWYTAKSNSDQNTPREPSLDYLPEYNKKEPDFESANDNSSTHSNEKLQMYNQQIENVKENESSLIIRRPREPSLDYLPEFIKKEPM